MRTKGRLCVMVLGVLFSLPPIAGQEVPPVQEKVRVVNVEVPVRVFQGKEAVDHLTRSDFTLYEDGVKQTIHGFFRKKRILGTQNVAVSPRPGETEAASRYIVLVFRVTSHNQSTLKGLDYLFENLIRPEDELLVFVNDQTILMDKPYWHLKRKDIIAEVIRSEGIRANQRLHAYFLKVKQELDQTRLMMTEDDPRASNVYHVIDFLRRYHTTWKEYKRRYLLPDMDNYYHFSRHLQNIRKEKWVINFYQIEMFPQMKVTGQLRQRIERMINELLVARSEDSVHSQIIAKMLEDIDRELNVAEDFPVEEIANLMYKVDTTYHTILIGAEKETLSQDLEFKRVSTDIENCMREITEKTGGALISSRNIGSALHRISETEDIYYILTYAPMDPNRIGRLRIQVKNPDYRLVYNDNMRADYIEEYLDKKKDCNPTILLSNLHFAEGELIMAFSDFKMSGDSGDKEGKIKVQIQLMNQQGESIYNQTRDIAAQRERINLSVDFHWLDPGCYQFIVNTVDLLTGKTATDFLETQYVGHGTN